MKVIFIKIIGKIIIVFFFFFPVSIFWGQTILFSEDFSGLQLGNNISTTGSKIKWNGNEQIPVFDYVYQAGGAVKLGITSSFGFIKTKPLDLSGNKGIFMLQFDIKGWRTVEGEIKINIENLPEQTLSYTAKMEDAFETKRIYFIGGKSNSTITFQTTKRRAFIGNIRVELFPFILASDLESFGEVCVASETVHSFIIEASLVNSLIRVNETEGYTFRSMENGKYYSFLEIHPVLGEITPKTIEVKFNPVLEKKYNNSIRISGGGAIAIAIPVVGSGINRIPVIMNSISSLITNNSAVITGIITDQDCSEITEVGFEYSNSSILKDGSGCKVAATLTKQNIFRSELINLEDYLVYYYKSYTITDKGIRYGVQDSFTTLEVNAPQSLEATAILPSEFTTNWTKIEDAVTYLMDISESPTFDYVTPSSDLIISEYIKGSSNNKAIELFNGTGQTVDLSSYSLKKQTNGVGGFKGKLKLTGILEANSTYVIVYSKANTVLKSYAIIENSSVLNFNGNDAIALYRDNSQIDVVGIIDQKAYWGKDMTLIRKPMVIHPTTEFSLQDWEQFPMNTFTNLGIHIRDKEEFYVTGYNKLDVGNTDSYTVHNLTEDRNYYYRVQAVGKNSTSSYSNTIKVPSTVVTPVWNGVIWSNQTGPDSTLDAIINGDYTTGKDPVIARNLLIKSGKFIVASGTSVLIQNEINVTEGIVIIENKGSLLQVNETKNTGEITIRKISNPMLRFDYNSWSSPVSEQKLVDFSIDTHRDSFCIFNPILGTIESTFRQAFFITARGYLIQPPLLWSRTIVSPYLGSFTGVPNNGTITIPLHKETNKSTGYNLIGNPYPSSISADAFIAMNTGRIGGTLYFWIPNHSMNNNRSYKASNYAKYTRAGGTSTKLDGISPNGVITVGQGFFVVAIANATQAIFTNTMRLAAHPNPFFMTVDDVLEESNVVERNRIWINLMNDEGTFSQILIAYMTDATDGVDDGIDGKDFGSEASAIYMLLDDETYAIQGKSLPFRDSDKVVIGFKALETGKFIISLDRVDGIFYDNQPVYIKDNKMNIIHNLKEKNYSFTSSKGVFEERFEIVYHKEQLPVFPSEGNVIKVYNQEENLIIHTGKELLNEVEIFDLGGRLLYKKQNINSNSLVIKAISMKKQILILRISVIGYDILYKKVAF